MDLLMRLVNEANRAEDNRLRTGSSARSSCSSTRCRCRFKTRRVSIGAG